MNVIGKILVILNLLFALVVGGFLVIDVATRTNWKNALETRDRDIRALNISLETWKESAAIAQRKAKQEEALRLAMEKNRVGDTDAFQLKIIEKERQVEKYREQARDAEAQAQTYLVQAKQYQEERDKLKGFIADRNDEIARLSKKELELTKKYGEAKAEAESAMVQASSLLEELRRVRREFAEMQAKEGGTGIGGLPGTGPKDSTGLNPPPRLAKGAIEKIDDRDKTLIQISIGLDEGVDKGHTLEVYRLTPEVEYLGVVRIIDSFHHKAVARWVRTGSTPSGKTLKVGDQVASNLSVLR